MENKPDMWDSTGEGRDRVWFRRLPEMTLAEAISGETGMVSITMDAGRYWLADSRKAGQDDFPSLEEAKAAGDHIVEEANRRQRQSLLESSGLNPEEWTVRFETNGPVFEKADESRLWLQVATDGQWMLMDGDVVAGTARTPVEAAQLRSIAAPSA